MEQHVILDHLNEHYLWALHYVYLPRINRALREFVNSWNNHSIRTANHKSPQQLFTAGALLLQQSSLAATDFFSLVDEEYGVDPNGPNAVDDEDGGITIPQTTLKFSELDLSLLRRTVDPLAPTQNYALELYKLSTSFSLLHHYNCSIYYLIQKLYGYKHDYYLLHHNINWYAKPNPKSQHITLSLQLHNPSILQQNSSLVEFK